MLTPKQVSEIRAHLERAQNPLFFFDNDQDGLCSFLLLQRFLGRGKGVPIKSFPGMTAEYFRKVRELDADYIFILDKPVVLDEFFEEARKVNIPVVWIDHHESSNGGGHVPDYVNYYNPLFNKNKTEEPVTALCYQVTQREEDLWIAVVGCISDRYVPEFYDKFEKQYPELSIKSRDATDIYYKSPIGKIAKMFSFGLKDRTTNVINMIRFLIKAKSPEDVLNESSKNYTMHKRFNDIEEKYQRLLKKAIALEKHKDPILFFQYGGDLSISSDLSNELNYLFPEKLVVVVYIKAARANISMRGEKSREIFLEAIEGLDEATGGGHEEAVGGRLKIEDIEKFRENIEKIVKQL